MSPCQRLVEPLHAGERGTFLHSTVTAARREVGHGVGSPEGAREWDSRRLRQAHAEVEPGGRSGEPIAVDKRASGPAGGGSAATKALHRVKATAGHGRSGATAEPLREGGRRRHHSRSHCGMAPSDRTAAGRHASGPTCGGGGGSIGGRVEPGTAAPAAHEGALLALEAENSLLSQA